MNKSRLLKLIESYPEDTQFFFPAPDTYKGTIEIVSDRTLFEEVNQGTEDEYILIRTTN
jgi:hypothetical protein